MKLTLKNGITVTATIIEDINTYRGFYVFHNKKYFKADFNTDGMDVKYKRGYEISSSNIIVHFLNKLNNDEELSPFEKIDFYDKLSDKQTYIQMDGEFYYFEGFLIPFYVKTTENVSLVFVLVI